MSVTLDRVVAGYGPVEVLHGVTLNAKKGEITGVIGPNGSGKSTLLKTILGILRPVEGKITFEGEDITKLRTDHILRKGISMCSQVRSIFPQMTVLENLEMGAYLLRNRNLVRERLEEIYSQFPILNERKNQLGCTLSGGEQRMLELGRAMMLHPKTLLLDEPSAMLAPKFLEAVFKKIEAINENGVTLVIVEQNVQKVLSVADQVYILDLGKNKFKGPSKEFLGNAELVKLYLGG